MRPYTIVGNWKMHMDIKEAESFLSKLSKKVSPHTHVKTVLCPPFTALYSLSKKIETDVFKLGAQNLNENDDAPLTGEISGQMIKGLADYVIVGHSERRLNFNETDKQVAKKLAAALRNKLKPILCVGESLNDRHAGHYQRVVVDQLQGDLSQVTAEDMRNILIAYEPIWAIGTGQFASPEDVEATVKVIRHTVEEIFGEAASANLEILYGGSVDPDNCKAYLQIDNVGGLLVGGASINYDQFAQIIKKTQDLSGKK